MLNPPRRGGRRGGDGGGRGRDGGGGGYGGGYGGGGGNRGGGNPNYPRDPPGCQPPGSFPAGVMIGDAPHQIPRSNFAPPPRLEALGIYKENDASEPIKAVQNMEHGLNRGGLLAAKLGQMALLDKNALPGRPGYCDTGRPVVVWANYFPIIFKKPNLVINKYNIVFIGKALPQAKKGRIIQLLLPMLELDKQKIGCRTNFRDILCTDKAIPANSKKGDKKEYAVKYTSEWQEPRPVDPDRPLPEFKVELVYDMGFQVSELLTALDPNKGEPLPVYYETMIQAMNAIFNHGPYEAEHTVAVVAKTGLNKYFDSRRVPGESTFHQLGSGQEAQRGFIKSVRLGTGRILLNVNTVTSVFTQPVSLRYYYLESLGRMKHPMKAKKMKLLKCGRIHLTKGARKKSNGKYMFPPATVLGFARKEDAFVKGDQTAEQKPRFVNWTWQDPQRSPGPKNVEFFFKEHVAKGKPEKTGEWITVFNYFKRTYPNVRLDDTLPVINIGSATRPSYVPMDVLLILPGNQMKAKLDSQQTQEMVKFACRAPKLNAAAIADRGRQLLGLDAPANAALASMGIEVGNNMIKVHARVLQPPKIYYAARKTIDVRFGSWNMQNVQFFSPGKVGPWSWVTMGPQSNVEKFLPWVQKFSRFMGGLGLPIGNFTPGKKHFCALETQIEQVFTHYAGLGVKLLLFILESDDTSTYRMIKMLGDIKFGLHTVCVQGKPGKFIPQGRQRNDPTPEGNPQYFANIGLKFNLKGGGINNTLTPGALKFIEEGKKTMVVGLDVTHPSPGSASSAKSVAAMVASVNWQLGQWPGTISVQRDQPPGSAREMIDELTTMLTSRLVLWQSNNKGQLPENILVYRDGISEGQYDLCLNEELPRLQAACRNVTAFPAYSRPGAFPRFTIVVCSKRHHTRFFPTKSNEASNTSNCQPGTVVDRDVTTPYMWESFLQAHHCIQGTAKPCRYIVIKDEIFSNRTVVNPRVNAATMLAELTNNMCHMFSRATKAVSLCPPAYYADILCERARVYLADHYTEDGSSHTGKTSQATGSDPYVDPESRKRITKLKSLKEEDWATLNAAQKAAYLNKENSDREAQQIAVTIHRNLVDTMFYI